MQTTLETRPSRSDKGSQDNDSLMATFEAADARYKSILTREIELRNKDTKPTGELVRLDIDRQKALEERNDAWDKLPDELRENLAS